MKSRGIAIMLSQGRLLRDTGELSESQLKRVEAALSPVRDKHSNGEGELTQLKTRKETAEQLHIAVRSLDRHTRADRIKCVKLGSTSVRYRLADIKKFIDQGDVVKTEENDDS